jgi:hypothetical protein
MENRVDDGSLPDRVQPNDDSRRGDVGLLRCLVRNRHAANAIPAEEQVAVLNSETAPPLRPTTLIFPAVAEHRYHLAEQRAAHIIDHQVYFVGSDRSRYGIPQILIRDIEGEV